MAIKQYSRLVRVVANEIPPRARRKQSFTDSIIELLCDRRLALLLEPVTTLSFVQDDA